MNQNDYKHLAALLDADAGIVESSLPDGVVLVNGSTLTPQAVRWLWAYWLALGKLHILAGAPGQGKTTIAIAAMATVTIGGRWPDGSRCEPGQTLAVRRQCAYRSQNSSANGQHQRPVSAVAAYRQGRLRRSTSTRCQAHSACHQASARQWLR